MQVKVNNLGIFYIKFKIADIRALVEEEEDAGEQGLRAVDKVFRLRIRVWKMNKYLKLLIHFIKALGRMRTQKKVFEWCRIL